MSDSDSDIDIEINRYIHDVAALSNNEFCRKKALQIRKPKNIQNFNVKEIMSKLKTIQNLDKFCVGESLKEKCDIEELFDEFQEIKILCRQVRLEKDDDWAKPHQIRKEPILPNIQIENLQIFDNNEDLIEEKSSNGEVDQPRLAATLLENTDELFGHENLNEALKDVTTHSLVPEAQPTLFHGDSQNLIVAQSQDDKYFENLFVDKSLLPNIELSQVEQLPMIEEHQLQQSRKDQHVETEAIKPLIQTPQIIAGNDRIVAPARSDAIQLNLRERHLTSTSGSPPQLRVRRFNNNKMTKFRDLKLHVQTFPPIDREKLISYDTVHSPVVMYLLNSIKEIIPNYQIANRATSQPEDITQVRMSHDIAQESRAMSQPRDITQVRVSHDIAQESQNVPHVSEIVSESNNLVHQELQEKVMDSFILEKPINTSDIPQVRDFTMNEIIPMSKDIVQSTPITEFLRAGPLNTLELIGHEVK